MTDLVRLLALATTLFVAAVVLGFAARRWRGARVVVAGIGPVCSLAVLLYFLIEGSTSYCTGTGATFRCSEVTYASTWGVRGSAAVAVVMILTMAPLVSAWLHNRTPAVVAAIALPAMLVLFGFELAAWIPAWAGVLAAAIAGPPSTERAAKETVPRI
jgi:hypothetical protein